MLSGVWRDILLRQKSRVLGLMLRLLASILLVFAFGAELRAAGDVGSQAPDFEFLTTWNMPGAQSRMSEFRGRPVLLEAFATW
jgi:hypothetical protein